ncbi:MAG: hypothetical protein MUO26_05835 [Methanotrichaceae archaeon]|nr:hypothetical protein [Methanotrichaceae archaeon]
MKTIDIRIEAITICGLEPNTIGIGPTKITPPIAALPLKPVSSRDAEIQSNPRIISDAPSICFIQLWYMHKL